MQLKPGSQKLTKLKNQLSFHKDQRAWIDLLLSKVALIFASIVILAALCHLAADAGRMNQERQLEAIAQDFRSAVDSTGRDSYGTAERNYSFDLYEHHGNFGSGLMASVSGEYVSVFFEKNGRRHSSVKPLTYKVLPYSEKEIRRELTEAFSMSGNISQPIHASPGAMDVMSFLATIGTREKYLNTSMQVHIEKTFIYTYNLNGTEVKELEYVLVYQ